MSSRVRRPRPLTRAALLRRAAVVMLCLLVLLPLHGCVLGSGPGRTEAQVKKSPWKLVFADEFRGGKLNRDKWTDCYWWDDRGCTNGSNEELQWYRPGNVSVSGGALHLEARRQTYHASDGKTYPFTSGMVSTGRATDNLKRKPRFAFEYGRVVARMRMPAGAGLWSAFWMMPITHKSRPEVDIMEILGHQPSRLIMHAHWREDGEKRQKGKKADGPDTSAGWHRYGLRWTPDQLTWWVDGKQVWKVERDRIVPDQPMYLLINLAVGGDYPGAPGLATTFPSRFDIDYVRVYQHR
ncbi:MAG TPA: glycoside hydrolase family 16 protein [Nocardioidaceae bacterium]|jgi:beta-glucanase (GH16 family)|nr:glycoside hydrolase family 16 protein [Nocardioidaceae bacterium]